MQTIKSYNLKLKEHKIIANIIGLSPKENKIYIRRKYLSFFKKRIKLKQKLKEESLISINFSARLKNYRYFRNINGYPCRGRRTHTNAKTKKKNKFKSILLV